MGPRCAARNNYSTRSPAWEEGVSPKCHRASRSAAKIGHGMPPDGLGAASVEKSLDGLCRALRRQKTGKAETFSRQDKAGVIQAAFRLAEPAFGLDMRIRLHRGVHAPSLR